MRKRGILSIEEQQKGFLAEASFVKGEQEMTARGRMWTNENLFERLYRFRISYTIPPNQRLVVRQQAL